MDQSAGEGICWDVAKRLDTVEARGWEVDWRLWGSCWEGEGRSLRRAPIYMVKYIYTKVYSRTYARKSESGAE